MHFVVGSEEPKKIAEEAVQSYHQRSADEEAVVAFAGEQGFGVV
jgi:hypothetical protein